MTLSEAEITTDAAYSYVYARIGTSMFLVQEVGNAGDDSKRSL